MRSVLSSLAKGVLAGAAGTLAMDLVWYRRYLGSGGEDPFGAWESASGTASFDEASAPAKLAEKAASVVGVELPDSFARTATTVVHWLTGAGYGAVGGIVLGRRHGVVVGGVVLGSAAYLNSYAVLGSLGLYEPIWDYDAETLRDDLTAHLTFGLVSVAALRVLGCR